MIRMILFLQLSDAQSTGLRQRRPPLETAARWRCGLANLTAYYNSPFCLSLNFLFLSGIPQMPVSRLKMGLKITNILVKISVFGLFL